jgi:hypothetical protein
MRKKRKGEYICNCRAYKFPHRFGGGKCNMIQIAEDSLFTRICANCSLYRGFFCEAIEGQESVREGACFQEFVELNEIKIYEQN